MSRPRIKKARMRYWALGPGFSHLDPETGVQIKCADDMLRYDTAFMCPKHPDLVITLQTNDWKGNVNVHRWHSFGIRSIVEMTRDHHISIPPIDPDAWFTYKHPLENSGASDYTKLVRVSLREYCRRQFLEIIN